MSRYRATPKTFVRPIEGWWRKNPYFVRYMIREASAIFVAGYALVLLIGLYRLHQGEAAYEGWRATLAAPVSVLLHLCALALVGYHSLTWFQVMPKTAPDLPIDPKLITTAGLVASAIASVLLLAVLWWATR